MDKRRVSPAPRTRGKTLCEGGDEGEVVRPGARSAPLTDTRTVFRRTVRKLPAVFLVVPARGRP